MWSDGAFDCPSGIGKAQLTHLTEAVMRSFRDHDETEYKKLVDWPRQMKTRGPLRAHQNAEKYLRSEGEVAPHKLESSSAETVERTLYTEIWLRLLKTWLRHSES